MNGLLPLKNDWGFLNRSKSYITIAFETKSRNKVKLPALKSTPFNGAAS